MPATRSATSCTASLLLQMTGGSSLPGVHWTEENRWGPTHGSRSRAGRSSMPGWWVVFGDRLVGCSPSPAHALRKSQASRRPDRLSTFTRQRLAPVRGDFAYRSGDALEGHAPPFAPDPPSRSSTPTPRGRELRQPAPQPVFGFCVGVIRTVGAAPARRKKWAERPRIERERTDRTEENRKRQRRQTDGLKPRRNEGRTPPSHSPSVATHAEGRDRQTDRRRSVCLTAQSCLSPTPCLRRATSTASHHLPAASPSRPAAVPSFLLAPTASPPSPCRVVCLWKIFHKFVRWQVEL